MNEALDFGVPKVTVLGANEGEAASTETARVMSSAQFTSWVTDSPVS